MTTPYLSEIRIMSFDFAPKGWALCNGQTLAISQYQALFSLIGTTYGGDGIQTFMLPNLQARLPIHFGTPPSGGGAYVPGQTGGEANHTLSVAETAAHSHTLRAKAANADQNAGGITPGPLVSLAQAAAALSGGQTAAVSIYGTGSPSAAMAGNAVGLNPGGQPHSNQQPYLALSFCIALAGIFPSRN